MVEHKLVIGTKSGKCYQRVIKDAETKVFLGKRIGESIKGDTFGLSGYEFEITGGSDIAGFPMRRDVPGAVRKKILAIQGVGIKKGRHGERQRKTVFGNTISIQISQINLKVTKEGKEPFEKPAEEAKTE
jgi:small subunit ribosomal protein S6e